MGSKINGKQQIDKVIEVMDIKKQTAGEKIIIDEKIETGIVKFSVVASYFKSCSIGFSLLFLICLAFYDISQLGSSIWLSHWSNEAKHGRKMNKTNDASFEPMKKESFTKFERLGVYMALGVLQYFSYMIMLLKSSRFLHNEMLITVMGSTMQWFESTPVGRIINRFSKDIEVVETVLPYSYKMILKAFFNVMVTVIIISIQTPYFLIALVPLTVIYVLVQRYYVATARQLRRLNLCSKSPIFSHFDETLCGIITIRAYKSQNAFINEMNNKLDENLIFYYPDIIANRLEFIGSLVKFLASILAVIGRNSLTGGAAGLSISYSLRVSRALSWLVKMSSDFEKNITSVERINEYFDIPREAEWRIEATKPNNNWPEKGNIIFKDYSFKYRDELDFSLKNIECNILPGEKIGIVGRTGAGKSSMTLALFRIIESNYGAIEIDDINIKSLGLHDLRRKLTIIPQDPVLFSGTLRMNLDPFEEYSDTQIWTALENAHLKEFVEGFENKLYQKFEVGENISIGQRQLICLARALLRKTKILILDEATAAIDPKTDDIIQCTIREQFADCTVITIAHRLNTILDSTRIIVMDQGRIVEIGSPKNLLENNNSVFYSMANSAELF